jgi:ribosomal protein S14
MIKRERKFCSGCGKPRVIRESLVYDEYTGNVLPEKVCMTYGCAHNRICARDTHTTGLFSHKCIKCGRPDYLNLSYEV